MREERDRIDEGEKNQGASGTDTHIAKALDLGTPQTGPMQVKNYSLPHRQFGLQKQVLQQSWFQTFERLKYSVQKNAAFCLVCRLYAKLK